MYMYLIGDFIPHRNRHSPWPTLVICLGQLWATLNAGDTFFKRNLKADLLVKKGKYMYLYITATFSSLHSQVLLAAMAINEVLPQPEAPTTIIGALELLLIYDSIV